MTSKVEQPSRVQGRLRTRFDALFTTISDTAVARERAHELPTRLVRDLADAGFTALRVPVEFGGSAVSLVELSELLVDLAAADSNIVQILRAHFLYTDMLRQAPKSPERDDWLRRIGNGDLIGGAYTERSAENRSHFSTTVTRTDDGRRLVSGEKFYSTGSWYADWIVTTGEGTDGITQAVVARGAPGVELLDDWNGFGQRLSVSGTTRFRAVDATATPPLPDSQGPGSYGTSLAQYWHIATLAGVARAAHRDVVEYVRRRRRYFAQGSGSVPAHDPVVQSVVGEISAAAFTAASLTRQLAYRLDELDHAISVDDANDQFLDEVEVEVYRAQVVAVNLVLTATTRLFDVGGASALDAEISLDRHWRNARTLASHNPVPHRLVSIGDHDLNGTSPFRAWLSGTDLRDRA
ncbi:acyl-CoA dehydrogenase family protein [Gordonia sp. NB41Y]|uniref:acyl-CoA dehydrogenase family protein n=1 Tax=Gordonia sp. NB41Y TaxID=875808 RepID=UPI0006B1FECB|nr:acyl-CoA dehydrogenase family protein [Gordonia sp. NB41Y]KOY48903.1 oxidoreductase [Gordonia sp. NB41Y]WLP92112.1 acyl-CoA dehydrogenase family protein [Gordonia sp. NB41Y]